MMPLVVGSAWSVCTVYDAFVLDCALGSVCVCVCVSVCACEVCVVFMIVQLAVCTEQTNTRLRLWGRERVFLFVFSLCYLLVWRLRIENMPFFCFLLFKDWELGRRPALNPWDYLTVPRVALYTWQLNIIQVHIAFQIFNWYNLQILQSHSLILEKCKVFVAGSFSNSYIVWPGLEPVQRRYQVAPIWGQFNDPVSTSWRVS